MKNRLLLGSLLLGAFVVDAAEGQPNGSDTCSLSPHGIVQDRIDWSSFLSGRDLVWDKIPAVWREGAFIGNGLQGSMIYAEGNGVLQWDVGRSDIIADGDRITIGRFELVGMVPKSGDMRLDLWNAEARGTLCTAGQELNWRSYTHAEQPVTIIELTGISDQHIEFRHAPALDTRKSYRKEAIPENKRNPEPSFGVTDGVKWCRQKFTAGGGYCVAWGEREVSSGRRLFAFTVDNSSDSVRAVADIQSALDAGPDDLARTHRTWWHSFWPRGGFLSIPDTRMENFYWIQMYKLASATRADGPAIDLMGPWFYRTPWARIWWNLNIQLTYWPVYAANRLELGESLTRMLDEGTPNLIANVPEAMRLDSAGIGRTSSYDCCGNAGMEIGNLTWAMHDYWLQYRYSGDETMLRERFYPLLRRAAMYMVHRLEPGTDGKLHFPVDVSPEYPERAPDTNYDLALLRWALQTLLAANDRLALNDLSATQWQETLAQLATYPVDAETGYMIGAGVPLTKSHRHFSHLFMVYPLHLVDPRSASARPLIEQSLDHWISFEGALQGYSFTGASAMSSWLGRNDASVVLLNKFLDRYVTPNTMYLEAGPVIETPLAGAAAIHEIVLQSWSMEPFGTDIRVFPAVPDAWKEVTIHKMLAEGAFEVSAERRNGKTQFVQIKSLAGAPCHVRTGFDGAVTAHGSRLFDVKTEKGMTTVDLRKGETVVLTPANTSVDQLVIEPVTAQADNLNNYGSRKTPPIQQDADGNFKLTADRAYLDGAALFTQGAAGEVNIGHWINADESVRWKLNVRSPGTFRVVATYAALGGGNRFSVQADQSALKVDRRSTGSWNVFQPFNLGTLAFPVTGPVTLEVRSADGKPVLINLREICLTKEPSLD